MSADEVISKLKGELATVIIKKELLGINIEKKYTELYTLFKSPAVIDVFYELITTLGQKAFPFINTEMSYHHNIHKNRVCSNCRIRFASGEIVFCKKHGSNMLCSLCYLAGVLSFCQITEKVVGNTIKTYQDAYHLNV